MSDLRRLALDHKPATATVAAGVVVLLASVGFLAPGGQRAHTTPVAAAPVAVPAPAPPETDTITGSLSVVGSSYSGGGSGGSSSSSNGGSPAVGGTGATFSAGSPKMRLADSGSDPACTAGTSFGTSGYDDIAPGTGVTVTDAKGVIIGTGSLGRPTFASISSAGREDIGSCVFPFTVSVPKTEFYSVEISHRGKLNYSYGELLTDNWKIKSSL